MRIKLIEIEAQNSTKFLDAWYSPSKAFACPSLALPIVASFLPQHFQVNLVDEKVDSPNLDDAIDVAAISFKSLACMRAYTLADAYRTRGIKVILGGVHTSLVPQEALAHADSIVVGEAEPIMPQLVRDLENNNLQKIYKAETLADLTRAPLPRFELVNNKKYLCHSIQTSRGCSLDCEFCPTRKQFGGTFRLKPIKKVLEEVERALSIEDKFIFFTDDIFGAGNKEYILALLKELRKLKIDFMLISDYQILDKEIILVLNRSGCRKLCINMLGTCMPEEVKAVRAIQSLGIEVWGYFGFGFKFQQKDVFEKVIKFIDDSGLSQASFAIMAPYPGTPMAERLEAAGKIFSKDWSLYDQSHVVFHPDLMSRDDLEKGFERVWEEKGYLTKLTPYYPKPWSFAIALRRCVVAVTLVFEKIFRIKPRMPKEIRK